MRLDRALTADLGTVVRARPIQLFLAIEVAAGIIFVLRRGEGTVSTVLLVWLAMLILAFFAWWAGRHPRAHPQPDPVSGAAARTVFALIGVSGMVMFGYDIARPLGFVLLACGFGGWLWSAWRTGGFAGLRGRLLRDPLPFVPMMLLIAVPRLVVGGPAYAVGAILALPSGIGQQLLYLLGLFAPLEALRRHLAWAAVVAALVFGLVHVPVVLEANHGDWLAAFANAVIYQASVGIIACLAFVRHRAAVPVGVVHALAIG